MRFEAVKITSEYDQIFNVEMILDIVDVQVGFTAKISALSEVRLKDELVTHLYVRYSGTVAEMDYMNACAAGFKQSLLDKE